MKIEIVDYIASDAAERLTRYSAETELLCRPITIRPDRIDEAYAFGAVFLPAKLNRIICVTMKSRMGIFRLSLRSLAMHRKKT